MKRLVLIAAAVAIVLSSCKESVNSGEAGVETQVRKTAVDPNAPIFREPEPEGGWPDGVPPTLQAAYGKQWKYQKKVTNGMHYWEFKAYPTHLLLKSQVNQPFWDTVWYELAGDTILPLQKDSGKLVRTDDFFFIERVMGQTLDLKTFSTEDLENPRQIQFKQQ